MNVLFVVPYPPSAVRVRSLQLIRGLVRRGHRVTVAAPWNGHSERADIERLAAEGVDVLTRRLPKVRSGWNCLCQLPGREPLQAAVSWHPGLAAAIHERLGSHHTDIVHVEHLRASQYALDLDSRSFPSGRPPIVWDAVDSISQLFSDTLCASRSGQGRWMARLDLERTRHIESTLPFRLERTVVSAEPDKAHVERLLRPVAVARGGSLPRVDVVPNGVDLDYFTPGDGAREPDTLVLSGKMSYHANETAALHLLRDVMPRVWRKRPAVRVAVVGRAPTETLRRLARREPERVTVTGFVPDIRPYLRRSAVSVVPVLYGAGTQLKLLEAMACGTPVISTSVGTRGLGLVPGLEVMVADDPAALADAILALLASPERRHRLGLAGRAYVERRQGWDRAVGLLESIYEDTLHASKPLQPGKAGFAARTAGTSQQAAKLCIDYVLAALLLLACAPLLALLAIVIKLDSAGPALHRRLVVGRGGCCFDAFKLRTMKSGQGEARPVPRESRETGEGGKAREDSRVTRVGRWLRRSSLDELPQLVNVLRGDMSLVGPRMMIPEELGRYGALGREVLTAKPGLTGLWQVSGRADLSLEERVRLDVESVRSFSLRRDLRILFVDTPVAVLTGRGAY